MKEIEKVNIVDSEQFCCATFVYLNWKIRPSRMNLSMAFLDKKNISSQNAIERCICAGLNTRRGAYVIIGINSNTFRVEEQIISEQQKNILIDYVENVKKFICPSGFSVKTEFLPIKTDPFLSNGRPKDGYFIGRITVVPETPEVVYYIAETRLGYHALYKIFQLSEITAKVVEEEQIYRLFSEKFYSYNKKKTKVHWDTICNIPEIFPIKICC